MNDEMKPASQLPSQEQAIVTRRVRTGVFLCHGMSDPKGLKTAELVIAIADMRKLEKLSKLSGPKFKAALEDDETRKELQDTISRFCSYVSPRSSVVSIESE